MDLRNSSGIHLEFIPGYQAGKGLHTGRVKIDPHKFCQTRKLTIYKMISARKSYTFQSLFKNITLLPTEKFGNINLYQQTVLLKIIYDFKIEISFMEK